MISDNYSNVPNSISVLVISILNVYNTAEGSQKVFKGYKLDVVQVRLVARISLANEC